MRRAFSLELNDNISSRNQKWLKTHMISSLVSIIESRYTIMKKLVHDLSIIIIFIGERPTNGLSNEGRN